jgi:hypothetical protein
MFGGNGPTPTPLGWYGPISEYAATRLVTQSSGGPTDPNR